MSRLITIDLLRAERPLEPARLDGPLLYRMKIGERAWTELRLEGSPALARALGEWTLGRPSPELPELLLRAFGGGLAELRQRLSGILRPQLCLRLCAMELHSLPWETLPLGPQGEPLGLFTDLRVCWPETQAPPWEQSAAEQLRVLVAWSAAGGEVPQEEHSEAWAQAWSEAGLPWSPELDLLPQLSLPRLRKALEDGAREGRPVGTLHLLCHGGPVAGSTGLWLDGAREPITGEQLAAALAPFAGSLRLVVLAACRGGDMGGGALGGVAAALHRAGLEAVIACRRPFTIPGSNRFARSLARGVAGLQGAERALAQARAQLLAQHRDDALALTLLARPEAGGALHSVDLCPYPGLRPFGPSRARFFFGRDREVNAANLAFEALEREGRPRLLLLTGPSGVGKSAVVEAGLARRQGQRPWTLRSLRPGADPLGALSLALQGVPEDQPLLLFVDQLEELFTQSPADQRAPFVSQLWSLASSARPLRVVSTLRTDFASRGAELRLGEHGPHLDALAEGAGPWAAHRLPVVEMSQEGLREAIVLPAQAAGLTLSPGLAELLLSETLGEPGALPLLAYGLSRLWERRKGRVLSLEEHQALGGVQGALRGAAEQVWEGLPTAHQAEARRLWVSLVDLSSGQGGRALDARRRVPLSELRPEDPARRASFDAALGAFTQARLLVVGAQPPTVEVAHEALLRIWPRITLWISEDRALLARLAEVERWVAEAEDPQPFKGPRLSVARELNQQAPGQLSVRALKALRVAEQGARVMRRRRALARGGVLALCLGALVSATLSAWYLRLTSESRALMRDAALYLGVDEAEGDPIRQARALLAVHEQDDARWKTEAKSLHALWLCLDRGSNVGTPRAWEPGDQRVLLQKGLYLWVVDPQDRARPQTLSGAPQQLGDAVWGAGRIFAADSQSGALSVWDKTLRPQPLPEAEGQRITAMAVSADGAQVALALAPAQGAEAQLLLLRASGLDTLKVGPSPIHALAWSPDGRLALGAEDGGVSVTTPGQSQPQRLAQRGGEVLALEWVQDTLAVGERSGAVCLLDAAGAERACGQLPGPVKALAARPGGEAVLASDDSGAALLLSPEARRLFPAGEMADTLNLSGYRGRLQWSPEGDQAYVPQPQGQQELRWEQGDWTAAPRPGPMGWSPSGQRWELLGPQGRQSLNQHPASPRLQPMTRSPAPLPPILAEVLPAGATTLQDPKGRALAVSSPGGLDLWSLGEAPRLLWRQAQACAAMAWHPNGKLLACAGPERVLVLDAQTGEERAELPLTGLVLAWSPDGDRLAVATEQQLSITTWRHGQGFSTKPLSWVVEAAGPMAWSPDGQRLALAPQVPQRAPTLELLNLKHPDEPWSVLAPCSAALELRWTSAETLELLGAAGGCTLGVEDLSPTPPALLLLPLHGADICMGPTQREDLLGEEPEEAAQAYEACVQEQEWPQ